MHSISRLDSRAAPQLIKPGFRQLIIFPGPQVAVFYCEEPALAGSVFLRRPDHRGAGDELLAAILFDERHQVVVLSTFAAEGQRVQHPVLIGLVLPFHG